MSVFSGLDISATGMTAQRLRGDIISQNLANVNTTRDEYGNVYLRKTVVFAEKGNTSFSNAFNAAFNHLGTVGNGVKVTKIVEDEKTATRRVYDPSHPDSDEDGYVTYPNVNVVTEMTDMIDASRAYEANITVFNGTKAMILKALEMGK